MVRLEFSGIEEYDELLDSILFAAWVILSAIGGGYVLLSASNNPALKDTLSFFFYFVAMGTGVFVFLADRKEAPEGRKLLTWSAIGIGGLLVIAFVSNMFSVTAGLVPTNQLSVLPNYLELTVIGSLNLGFTTLFGTMYFVGTGEEVLKALGLFFFNIFDRVEEIAGFSLPETLAAQPLIWVIVILWAGAHTILGQNPAWYAVPVFFDGIWLMHVAYKGGSWLAAILAHVGNNTFFLGLTLLSVLHIL